jgi:hypothetical protein
LTIINNTDPPEVSPGNHCLSPYACPFLGTACEVPPVHELSNIPNYGPTRIENLHTKGINTLDDLSNGSVKLNETQKRALKGHLTGERQVESGIKEAIQDLGYPRFHLDFETTGSLMILPVLTGSRPFQPIPFQFSLHIETAPGETASHDGYLHFANTDPRRPMAESLIEMVGELPGKILMYSPYEKMVLNNLKRDLPDLANKIDDIIIRLVDLLPIVKEYVYDPQFKGSFSIKKVLPALVEGENYANLEIQDGDTASIKYLEMIEMLPIRQNALVIRNALWLYCQQDTKAMVDLVKVLEDLQ